MLYETVTGPFIPASFPEATYCFGARRDDGIGPHERRHHMITYGASEA